MSLFQMSLSELLGLVTGFLTIAGAIVAVVRYITQLQSQVRLERLQVEKEQAEKARADLAATNKLLLEELAAARRVGAAASAKKSEIDDEVASVMKLAQAGAASVYIPFLNDTQQDASGLVFLSIQPTTQQTLKLRKKIIPMRSLAGRCYTTGKTFVVGDPKSNPDHYNKADGVTGYKTQDMLSVPLRCQDRVVGVLQLLNKEGSGKFVEEDFSQVERYSSRLASKVDEFARIPEGMETLGIVPQRDTQHATVMFCDLTASATLFQELNPSAAVQHINEYFQAVCDVAFSHGATVDKYMGDGLLLRFNVPHRLENHPLAAVKAAFGIRDAFEKIKKDWLTMGEMLGGIYTRVGIAYGPVQQATVGHPQHQSLTIFGTPVNVAVNLCEIAPRDHSVIVIDDLLHQKLNDRLKVRPMAKAQIGKAGKYVSAAYELQELLSADNLSTGEMGRSLAA